MVVALVETHGRERRRPRFSPPWSSCRRVARSTIADSNWAKWTSTRLLARRPQLAVIDEFAHTNAPGSRHPKRWQDVMEALDAGVDVVTTLNIQHIESLNDAVAQITGVRVQETVPDEVLARADQIELIDLPPEELIQRLKDGKVYRGAQAGQALDNFFTRGSSRPCARWLCARPPAASTPT